MRFNSATKTQNAVQPLLNHEGATAYAMTPELELYSAVVTTMLADVTYEKANQRLDRIRDLATKVSPLFLAKLAVYARETMYLRTAPVVLLGDLAMWHNGDDLVSRTVNRVVQRPDEITELLAYYQAANHRQGVKKLNRLSKQIQKGLAQAFNRFDAYQFAKYDRQTAVTLRDALFLVHPKAKDDAKQAVFDQIAQRTLDTPYTWETELSALGQQTYLTDREKRRALRDKWHELIDSGRLGYMAMLRNLRNMLEADINGAHVKAVCEVLADPRAVQKAKQLPFRFLAAYRELKGMQSGYVSLLCNALERALQASVANLRGFSADTHVVVACDVSGSMQTSVSAKSKVLLYDIGLLLGMLLQTKCANVVSGMFGDRWKVVPLAGKNVLANVESFYRREGEVGYATNGYLVIEDLIRRKHRADKVMLFTDVQLWDSVTNNRLAGNTLEAQWIQYKTLFPEARLYLFDLAGHGHSPMQSLANGVTLIAGWSDKVFDVLQAVEHGDDMLAAIYEIRL
jgi:60 kDa SS-A/Ro ribonucleoprotein